MLQKIIASVLVPALLLQVNGCYSINEVNRNNISKYNGSIKSIILINGTEIKFDIMGGRYMSSKKKIIGYTETKNLVNVKLKDVAFIRYEEKDMLLTKLVVALFSFFIYAAYLISKIYY